MSELVRGEVLDGRYVVEGLLARGGMAAVYLVRHQTLGSHHALKVLEITREAVRKRLVQEGVVQARIRHPNVVMVSDVLDVRGHPALLMEYVNGPSLAQVVAHTTALGKALPTPLVDSLAQGIFDGLEEAHRAGLVHRDLKPHNIMLAVSDRGVVPKITDFGLVKVLGEDGGDLATRTAMVCGTPEYMSPEQGRSAKHVDARSDIFSLGVILYELSSGVRPYAGSEFFELLERVASGEHVPLGEVAPHAPQRVVDAVEACLVSDRERRLPSVEAVRERWFGDAPLRTAVWDREWLLSLAVPTPAPAAPWEGTGATLIGPPPGPDTVDAPLTVERDAGSVWIPVGIAASLLAALISAGTGGLGLLMVAWMLVTRASTPAAPAAVAPAAALPAPVPAEEEAPVAPEPSAPVPALPAEVPVETRAPPPVPGPRSEEPSAVRAPEPEPSPAPPVEPPAPAPEPVPAPASALPPRVRVLGATGITVVLRDTATGRSVAPAEAQVGTYEVIAFYEPNVPTVLDRVDLGPGEPLDIRCNSVRCGVAH